jgi:hypothetical protein
MQKQERIWNMSTLWKGKFLESEMLTSALSNDEFMKFFNEFCSIQIHQAKFSNSVQSTGENWLKEMP